MMEFTLSRVALMVCGVIMLAAVTSPVSSIFDEKEESCIQQQSENIAGMLDLFYESQADEMVICLSDMIPSAGIGLIFDGRFVELNDGNSSYRSAMRYVVESDDTVYNVNDIVRLTKTDGSILVERMI